MRRRNARRRIHWGRKILGFVFAMLLAADGFIMIANAIYRNDILKQIPVVDNQSPVIELKGGNSLTVAIDEPFSDPGFDAYDDSVIPKVEIESNVNPRKEGDYKIKYLASDEAGNNTSVERSVKVIRPKGEIYLTFDDGPSEYTALLLDILKKYGVRATFFVTGFGDDALILREFNDGHAVGLHTFTHNYAEIYTSIDNYASDLQKVNDRVKSLTGKATHLLRFPGGSSNMVSSLYDNGSNIMSALVSEVEKWGYKYFDWNVDSDDAGSANSADEVFNNVVNSLKVGDKSIVLQHDTKQFSIEAVERIIDYGLSNGFVFMPLSIDSFSAHHSVNN